VLPQNRTEWLVCGALALLVATAFAPVSRNQFVNYDDGVYLHQNPGVQQGLSAQSIRWAFTTGHAANWHPLTWIIHTLNWSLFRTGSSQQGGFGSDPQGHHLVNVGIHAVSSVSLFWVLMRLTNPRRVVPRGPKLRKAQASAASATVWPAAFVAAMFAVHPLRVESVAWAAELKDVLSTLFWWLSIAAYVAYVRQPTRGRYGLVVLFFALGLMSKPMIVSLPLVLLLLDWWPLERFDPSGTSRVRQLAKLVIEKIPLFTLAGLGALATYIAQSRGGTTELLEHVPLHLRLANGALSIVAYLRQTFWPTGLACFYPYPRAELMESGLWRFEVLAAMGFVLVASAAAIGLGRRRRYALVGWFWYLITLVPVIGIIQVGQQARADRYTYVPLVGIYLIIAWGGRELVERLPRLRPYAATLGVLAVVACCALTWRQVGVWRDDITLFSHAAKVVPRNDTAHRNLGSAYFLAGEAIARQDRDRASQYVRLAIEHLQKAIELRPEYASTYRNLALVMEKIGRPREAAHYFREAIQRDPKWALPLCNLAMLYATRPEPELRKPAEAVRLAQRAVELTSGADTACLRVLATVYAADGQLDAAIGVAERGEEMARQKDQPALAEDFGRLIRLLRSKRGAAAGTAEAAQ
jgi:hypothetical protein